MSSYPRMQLKQAEEHAQAAGAHAAEVISLSRKLVALTCVITALTVLMLVGLGLQIWLALRECAP